MQFLNALEQARRHIHSLWGVVLLLVVMDALVTCGWLHAQSKIKITVPPHIPRSGLTLTQNAVPKTTVYSFAYYVWQSINYWHHDGLNDYKTQITRFSPFLTPHFKVKLVQNYNYLLNEGELQDRIRLMQGVSGSEYSPKDVVYIGHDTWIVRLTMRLTEMVNSNAKVVKDVEMHYALKVVRYDVDTQANPWGLGIAGFAHSPRRIKTMI